MLSGDSKRVAAKAKKLFQEKYRTDLEKSNPGAFVCIEPESGDYFLGQTLDDAVNQAIPLRGTMLLDGHDLAISYERKTLTLD